MYEQIFIHTHRTLTAQNPLHKPPLQPTYQGQPSKLDRAKAKMDGDLILWGYKLQQVYIQEPAYLCVSLCASLCVVFVCVGENEREREREQLNQISAESRA
jgi:hypothetical protein